jgi:chaperonin GroES
VRVVRILVKTLAATVPPASAGAATDPIPHIDRAPDRRLDKPKRRRYLSSTLGYRVLTHWHREVEEGFMKFRPLHDRVVIRRVEEEEKSKGGIIIPDTAKEKPMEGEVIAAGPGARGEDGKIHALDVKAGDRVLFGKWSGTEVKLDGEELIIMKESDIMGVIA